MQKSENINITWMRAIASIMVVILHTVGYFVYLGFSPLQQINSILGSLSHPAVPIFAMVSGFLLWNRELEPSFTLAAKRFWKIFSLIAYFGIAYYFIYFFISPRDYSIMLIFFSNEIVPPFGYLFAILPIYTLSAFISLPKGRSQSYYILLFLLLVFLFFIAEGLKTFPFGTTSLYYLHTYFFYMLMGFALGHIKFPRLPYIFSGLYLFISLIMFYCTSFLFAKQIPPLGYGSVFTMFQAVAFFGFIRSLDIGQIIQTKTGNSLNSLLSMFAQYSTGIYGWHWLIKNIVKNILNRLNLQIYQEFLILLVSTLLLSLLFSMADTWFWARVRAWLVPLWQKISTCLQKKLPFPKNP